MQYLKAYQSPLGSMTMASNGEKLTGLWFDGQKYDRAGIRAESAVNDASLPIFDYTVCWLDHYFAGTEPGPVPPICISGTPFQKEIWELLCAIPKGSIVTYGELAVICASQKEKSHMAAQAVGGAVGHNPISIIIPCHRVTGATGSLTGYAGEIWRKKWLLEHEGIKIREDKVISGKGKSL